MDIKKFVDGLVPWLKSEFAPLFERVAALEQREVIHGKDGADGRDGIDGKDGAPGEKGADGLNGRDGIDGKDVDPDLIKNLVAEEVSKIPAPQDGKDADVEQVRAIIVEEVAKIPAPKDGKDADLAEIKAIIQQEVAEIPKPVDGKDVDPEQIEKLVSAAVAKIPAPQNGKDGESVDVEKIREIVKDEIRADSMFQKDSDVRERNQLIAECVEKVQAAIVLPANGKNGSDGIDGRDGLDIEILPSIDETKSAPRGTYAQHAGGLWKAYQKTVGMKGWECIVVGIADIQIEQTSERSIAIKTILSNGETQEKEFALPNTIYKGVYEQDAEYVKGDILTWGGSIWHCNEPTTERPREGHKAWTLAVKKGRDYREPVKNDFDPNKPVKM